MPQRSSVVSRLIMFVGKTLIHVNIRIYLGPNIYFHLRLLYTIVRSDENICKFTQHTDGAARREFFEICTSFLKKAFLKSSTVIKEVWTEFLDRKWQTSVHWDLFGSESYCWDRPRGILLPHQLHLKMTVKEQMDGHTVRKIKEQLCCQCFGKRLSNDETSRWDWSFGGWIDRESTCWILTRRGALLFLSTASLTVTAVQYCIITHTE
jgi:hypothetical protein